MLCGKVPVDAGFFVELMNRQISECLIDWRRWGKQCGVAGGW